MPATGLAPHEDQEVHLPGAAAAAGRQCTWCSRRGGRDCAKVRALRPGFAQRVPFVRGAEQIVAGFEAHAELQDYDPALDVRMDELVARYGG